MKITATVKTMTPGEAMQKARGGGNALGKAMYGGKDINLRLMYLENFEIILKLNYQPAPLMRWLGIKPKGPESQLIRMIVEGTRCTASYHDDGAGRHTNITYGDYFLVEALMKLTGRDPMLWM